MMQRNWKRWKKNSKLCLGCCPRDSEMGFPVPRHLRLESTKLDNRHITKTNILVEWNSYHLCFWWFMDKIFGKTIGLHLHVKLNQMSFSWVKRKQFHSLFQLSHQIHTELKWNYHLLQRKTRRFLFLRGLSDCKSEDASMQTILEKGKALDNFWSIWEFEEKALWKPLFNIFLSKYLRKRPNQIPNPTQKMGLWRDDVRINNDTFQMNFVEMDW